MPFFPLSPQRRNVGPVLALLFSGLTLLTGSGLEARADQICFYDGATLQGKLSRVTGEIIEFREGGLLGRKHFLNRLQLNGRQDTIDMADGHQYVGEIVYMDMFKIDIRTEIGLVKLTRLRISNIRVGVPPSRPVAAPAPENSSGPVYPVSDNPDTRISPDGEQPATTPASPQGEDADEDNDFP